MSRWHRHIIRIAALVAAGAILIPVARAAGNAGDVNLAKGVLQTQFGFSPSRAADWTTGVCSYADKPSSCYLTTREADEQSPPAGAAVPSSSAGDAGLAQSVLESQFGFSPSRAEAWTTGVCSYTDNPSSCYLTPYQAKAQSYAEAQSMGALASPPTAPVATVTLSPGFQWGDAGVGAGATLGLVLIIAGIGAALILHNRRRTPIHA